MTEATFRSTMLVEVVDHMGSDLTPVTAARLSTGTETGADPRRDLGLLNYLMRDGHHVPFEHTVVSFSIEAPIFVTRQILKHRAGVSISEESGRYRELPGVFYIPSMERPVTQVGKTGDYEFVPDDYTSKAARWYITDAARGAWASYQAMLDEGVAKEVARMALPVNTYSKMFITMNSRALMNFFKLRLPDWGSHPQYEIEDVARQMFQHWTALFPETSRVFLENNPVEVS